MRIKEVIMLRTLGTCTFYNPQRGYAFLTTESGTQYFLHLSNFTPSEKPVVGAYISFMLGAPVRQGTKLQAMDARFASQEEIELLGHGRAVNGGAR
jgi:cold shock CspA family protein